jgi:RimJ/RimL family protein N-acetyltransferase
MNKNDIVQYSAIEKLRDGRNVTIRAIRPEDKGDIAEQVKQLSPETVYLRTFAPKRALDDRDLKRMTDVDFENVVALVAVVAGGGQEQIVGGGRYFRMGEGEAARTAEVAFLIGDPYQGLGIGSRIFRHLVSIARATGIEKFEAIVLPSNDNMLRLFERSGLKVTKMREEDTLHVTIGLT